MFETILVVVVVILLAGAAEAAWNWCQKVETRLRLLEVYTDTRPRSRLEDIREAADLARASHRFGPVSLLDLIWVEDEVLDLVPAEKAHTYNIVPVAAGKVRGYKTLVFVCPLARHYLSYRELGEEFAGWMILDLVLTEDSFTQLKSIVYQEAA